MSLDGLRAWIGEVERKLGMRTRVFLALAAIAIGASGAAIYLALDAREGNLSEEDVEVVEQRLQEQIGAAAGGEGGADVAQLEADLEALRREVERLRAEDGANEPQTGEGASPQGGASSGGGDGGETAPSSAEDLRQLGEEAAEKAKSEDAR